MKKRVNYKTYLNKFKEIVENKIPVTGIKYDSEVSETIGDMSEFRQCYMKGDKVREAFPRYWFLSREGFLISVKGKSPKWIKPNLKSCRPEFGFYADGKTKFISTYTLVALVWDSYVSGDARKILNAQGIKALGKLQKINGLYVPKVQGHHKDQFLKEKNIESYVANNNPENVQILTVREHDVLNNSQRGRNDISVFYQPDFRIVPNESIQAYDLDRAEMLDLSNIQSMVIQEYDMIPKEKDSIMIGDYVFILEDGRDFLEKNRLLIEKGLEDGDLIPKPDSVKETIFGITYYILYLCDKKIWYRKIN